MENKAPLNIKSWAEADRPREKLLTQGHAVLTNAELIAILLGTGTKTLTAVDLAKNILNTYQNSLSLLSKATYRDLIKTKGVGSVKAITLLATMEIARRRQAEEPEQKVKIRSSTDIYNYMKRYLLDLPHEEMYAMYLDKGMKLLALKRLSVGGVSSTLLDMKILFSDALGHLASNIILVHNHPSGSILPSDADKNITLKAQNAGKLLDIRLQDHLIFTNSDYFSFADEGLL